MNEKPVIRIVNPSSVDYTFLGQAPRIITDKQDTKSEKKEKNLRKSIKYLKNQQNTTRQTSMQNLDGTIRQYTNSMMQITKP